MSQANISQDRGMLESSVDAQLSQLRELQTAILLLRQKVLTEGDKTDWPALLDGFALISSQFATLRRILRSSKGPLLSNYSVLPLSLNPNSDEQLHKLTDRRYLAFTHDIVPNLLRTKACPEAEMRISDLLKNDQKIAADEVKKQVGNLNGLCGVLLNMLQLAKDERGDTDKRCTLPSTFHDEDSRRLAAVVRFGRGLTVESATAPDVQHVVKQSPATTSNLTQPNAASVKAVRTNIRAGARPV